MSPIVRRKLPQEVASSLGPHPVFDRLLAARGVSCAEDMNFALKNLPSPESLHGMQEAVALLSQSLEAQQRILVVGDYDADGATSTALLVTALREMGAKHADYLLPNRFDFGYGLSPAIVELARTQAPDLIITVDNGIASLEGVAKAQEYGIRVLITDHHLPPEQLPTAEAIVNPNLQEDQSGCGNLAGVGVIFYVMLALRKQLLDTGWFKRLNLSPPNLAELLDLVAVGTVADVVRLDKINRILVEQGMRRIRANRTRPGIRALLQLAGKSRQGLCAADIGFGIGPRLNAAGRLSDMTIGVECLLTDSDVKATELATQLDELNRRRRDIEKEMREEAELVLGEQDWQAGEHMPSALCLYEPHWHQGVVGILASRIKDSVHRPVIVFASDENGQLKGSGRSIPGVHLRDALDSVASANPGLVEKFGGHAMAAGLSLQEDNLTEFDQAFQREVSQRLEGVALNREYLSDGELPVELLALDWAETVRFLAPWGQGFPEPQFDGEFDVVHARIVGERHLKLRLSPAGDSTIVDAIAFNQAERSLPQGRLRLVYRLDVNEFRGDKLLQLQVQHLEAL